MEEKKDRVGSALLAVFPVLESIIQFAADDDNYKALRSLIDVAYQHKVIATADKTALFDFVRDNAIVADGSTYSDDLNLERFFDRKDELLELNFSLRALTDHINTLLRTHKIKLPKVTNTMLSRLKRGTADTPHQQNVLRSIAFWIGYHRSHLISQWNYESLWLLCKSGKQFIKHKTGVRIGFSLTGRGEVIEIELMDWLRKNIKIYIESSLGQFSYGNWGRVRTQDLATMCVDFPSEELFNSPAAYLQCVRSAISLAHQISVRWSLTPHCSQNRFLAIGIAAGEFDTLDNHLLPILNAALPGDPVIRLTDFARQCVLVNEIRAILCNLPVEVTLFNGEILNIWWVVGVWSTIYFDFVPELLEDPLLSSDVAAAKTLFNHLWGLKLTEDDHPGAKERSNAIGTFLRSPGNSMLGLEIAKALYFRRRYWEAIHFLKILLSLNATLIHARTLLMALYRSLALIAPNHSVAQGFFKQAQREALYVLKHCDHQSEDFYCEYAVNHLDKAMLTLRNLRCRTIGNNGTDEFASIKKSILTNLAKAETLFEIGMMISPSGIRARYMHNSTKVLRWILQNDATVFTHCDRPLDGHPDLIRKMNLDYQWQYGLLREDIPQEHPYASLEQIFSVFIQSHDDSIGLQAYRSTVYFCSAVVWWDFYPIRTVGIAKRVILLLQQAMDIAKVMDAKGVCIYSFTRTYGEVIPAKDFIQHIERSIAMVEAYSGGRLDHRKEEEIIEPQDPERMHLLMTLNF